MWWIECNSFEVNGTFYDFIAEVMRDNYFSQKYMENLYNILKGHFIQDFYKDQNVSS